MTGAEVFAAAASQRRRFADLVEGLTDEQLDTPSLCGRWTVRDVAGHIAFAIAPQMARFGFLLVRHGLRFDRANEECARGWAARPSSDIVARIRASADGRFHPPGLARAPLADITIHTQDVARPLGLDIRPPAADVAVVLDLLRGEPFGFVRRGASRGLHLVADDLDLEWGDGPDVRGPGLDLALALCGRRSALDRLSGDGVPILAARWAAIS